MARVVDPSSSWCEALTFPDEEGQHIVLKRCGKPAKLRKKFVLPYGVMLCDECLALMEAK